MNDSTVDELSQKVKGELKRMAHLRRDLMRLDRSYRERRRNLLESILEIDSNLQCAQCGSKRFHPHHGLSLRSKLRKLEERYERERSRLRKRMLEAGSNLTCDYCGSTRFHPRHAWRLEAALEQEDPAAFREVHCTRCSHEYIICPQCSDNTLCFSCFDLGF